MSSLKEKAKFLPQITLDALSDNPEFVLNINVGEIEIKKIIVGFSNVEFKAATPKDNPKIELTLTNVE
jgi:hypothetical protein